MLTKKHVQTFISIKKICFSKKNERYKKIERKPKNLYTKFIKIIIISQYL